ncbi:MAG TPA: site-specific integrase [Devosia sp.]|nr:site-specific integrase [Devosia sp.]
MARFGKGKPMGSQARAVLKAFLSLTSRHAAKQAEGIRGSRSTGRIHSLATFNKYATALKQAGDWAKEAVGLRHLKAFTPELAQQYLTDRAAQGIGQKQLDTDRNALEFITGKGSLVRERALTQSELHSRAYSPAQIRLIAAHQSDRNALATELAWRAGLRAHELLTLQRAGEARAASHRHWSPDRFLGRDGERYIVTGKGGLRREVMIPHDLAARLEARRLETGRVVVDRGITYRQHYDIGGGNAWSKSFSEASSRVLGWSHGAHGLRHSYAQERMQKLQGLGKAYYPAREILSQELGHFRGDIVEVYLR